MGQTPRVLNYSPLNEIEKHLIFEITCFFHEENQIEKESFQNQSFHCHFATHSSLSVVQPFWLCHTRLFEICICHCLNCCHRCPHLLQSWTPRGTWHGGGRGWQQLVPFLWVSGMGWTAASLSLRVPKSERAWQGSQTDK